MALSTAGQVLAASATLGDDQQVLDFVTGAIEPAAPGLVAIDAPLAVPNETGARPCDHQVAAVFGRFEAAPYPANRRNLRRYGGLRAENLREQLQCLGFRHEPFLTARQPTRQLVEVFPHPAIVSLFHLERTLKYKARSARDYSLRWSELSRLRKLLASLAHGDPSLHLSPGIVSMPIQGLRGTRFKEAEDLLDAFVCAYSALFAWHYGPRGYAIYGDAGSGHILVPMTPAMWQRIKGRRILFLDRDGTLNRSFSRRPPRHPGEVELLPAVASILHQRAAMGWRLVIISNHGGVAFGYQTEQQVQATHQAVLDALPVEIDASYLCPHNPEGTIPRYSIPCPNRKPAPGAVLDALRRFSAKADQCLFVGDMDSDRQAASAAGVPFMWARQFFGWEPS